LNTTAPTQYHVENPRRLSQEAFTGGFHRRLSQEAFTGGFHRRLSQEAFTLCPLRPWSHAKGTYLEAPRRKLREVLIERRSAEAVRGGHGGTRPSHWTMHWTVYESTSTTIFHVVIILDIRGNTAPNLLQPPNPKSSRCGGAEQELGTRAPWPSSIHPQLQRPLPVGPHTLTSDPAGRALQRARRSRAPLDPSSALHLCPLCPFRVGHLRAVTPLARS